MELMLLMLAMMTPGDADDGDDDDDDDRGGDNGDYDDDYDEDDNDYDAGGDAHYDDDMDDNRVTTMTMTMTMSPTVHRRGSLEAFEDAPGKPQKNFACTWKRGLSPTNLACSCNICGALLGTSWTPLRASFVPLGASWEPLGSLLGSLRNRLEASWDLLRAKESAFWVRAPSPS